jgi:hypothetical protein
MSEHTPGELFCEQIRNRLFIFTEGHTPSGSIIIATCDSGLADAKRIVTAWNCHDDLLAACEAALGTYGPNAGCWITTKLTEAIAKARGQTS